MMEFLKDVVIGFSLVVVTVLATFALPSIAGLVVQALGGEFAVGFCVALAVQGVVFLLAVIGEGARYERNY